MSQGRKCLFSGKEFIIRDEDIEFLKKVSPVIKEKIYEITPPSLCPSERERRRLAFRNERVLFKIKSSLSGKSIISFFDENTPFKIFSHDEWWSDKWDGLEYGENFDFNRSFFDQFYDLQLKVPRPPLVNNKAENSDYCNFADENKNCYLITCSNRNEDCFYSFLLVENTDAMDCVWCSNGELLYECVDCKNCYNVKFAQNCINCRDSSFLLNCQGVKNCMFCINLKNKSYYIFNKLSSKEEYDKFVSYLTGSYKNYQEALKKFEQFKIDNPIRRANNFISSENICGENIFNSKNIYFGFDIYDSQDLSYAHDGLKAKDCSDICYFDGPELCYESTSLMGYGYRFTIYCRNSYNLFYCDNCHSCKNCFGCTGLRNKEYCIFNKQYSKDNYEDLVPRIITHMTPQTGQVPQSGVGSHGGEWGQFFPVKYSLFPYNHTLAQDYFPITKDDALKNSWKWADEHVSSSSGSFYSVPDNINDVSNDVCNNVLICKKTGRLYKIIVQELEFYRKMKLPIPRKCPDERHKERMSLRNSRSLWDRKCNKCGTEIKTSYSPERFEKIYCEKCYLETVC